MLADATGAQLLITAPGGGVFGYPVTCLYLEEGSPMKVLLVNGGPHKNGCTHRALAEIAATLEAEGIETQEFWVGAKPVGGCMGCGACRTKGSCVIDDKVNEFAELAAQADGFVFGTPVHYASASGNITSFMDRLFYSTPKSQWRLKPAAAITSARRAGTTAAFDQLNKYFTINEMPIVSSKYWNNVHGNTAEEVERDLEGLQIMRTLARNMAYLLRCRETAAAAGIEPPAPEETPERTNFIR